VTALEATLCEIIDGSQILLQKKSTGKFGEGKWNGSGGKLRTGEMPKDGVVREVYEETGLKAYNLKFHGVLKHFFGKGSKPDWVVHIFSTRSFEGKLKESDEGVLRWFKLEEIPYGEMWEDDKHWLPLLLDGTFFDGEFYFDEKGAKLLHYNLDVRE